jgi:histidinol-phosphate aminotransferase
LNCRHHANVQPSPRLRDLAPCPHGSVTDAELQALGLARGAVIDFSASTNPLGPPPGVKQALAALEVGRYPDDTADAFRSVLAAQTGLPTACLLAGNGSSELIWLLALAYLDPGDPVLVVGPTFGEYARAGSIMGATVTEWRADEAADFQPDVPALCAAIRQLQPKLVFLCNPNNPTGVLLDRGEIVRILGATAGLLVVDEAYIGFVAEAPTTLDLIHDGRLAVLRSLTKDYALTGLRLGYVAAAPQVIEALRQVRPPWSVNAAAQAAGIAALGDAAHLQRSLAVLAEAKTYLLAELPRLGLRPVSPAANFLLAEVDDGAGYRCRLLRQGCVLRDCASFGLPAYVRIAVRTLPECRRLVAAIATAQGASVPGAPA